MPTAIVIGGGLAGLAAASALGSAGFQVDLFEARGFLGGRATSYPISSEGGPPEIIDNCQHILLRCCVNLVDFYKRLGVADRIHFHKQFYFIEPGGRTSILRAGRLPAPLHLMGSFRKLNCLSLADKFAIARGLLAIRREHARRTGLDRMTMLDWLREKRQTQTAISRFWRQILVSAINEELDRMPASVGSQVFWLGFLAQSNSYQMGIPAVPLGDLYAPEAWKRIGNVNLHLREAVDRVIVENGSIRAVQVAGEQRIADHYV